MGRSRSGPASLHHYSSSGAAVIRMVLPFRGEGLGEEDLLARARGLVPLMADMAAAALPDGPAGFAAAAGLPLRPAPAVRPAPAIGFTPDMKAEPSPAPALGAGEPEGLARPAPAPRPAMGLLPVTTVSEAAGLALAALGLARPVGEAVGLARPEAAVLRLGLALPAMGLAPDTTPLASTGVLTRLARAGPGVGLALVDGLAAAGTAMRTDRDRVIAAIGLSPTTVPDPAPREGLAPARGEGGGGGAPAGTRTVRGDDPALLAVAPSSRARAAEDMPVPPGPTVGGDTGVACWFTESATTTSNGFFGGGVRATNTFFSMTR